MYDPDMLELNFSNDYMIWSIINAILFIPHIYITLPNIFLSWLTRKYNKRSDFKLANYYSKWSLIFNIVIDILFILEIVAIVLICVFLVPTKTAISDAQTNQGPNQPSIFIDNYFFYKCKLFIF